MPPALAARFTVGELAVLRIVGDEVRASGLCGLCIDAIAARAGVCRRTAQNAIRQAARLGLLTIQERRREGQKNLPNIIRVISREWLAWLRLGARRIAASPARALEQCHNRGVHGRLWRKALATQGGAAARDARASVVTSALKAARLSGTKPRRALRLSGPPFRQRRRNQATR